MRVTLPSPTAASLGKFGDVPVSLSTGVPDIRIPLFTAKGRALEVPIVLKYHAAGIRVEEIAGWAGLGWTLEAGGTITRTVRGLADESSAGYFNTGHTFYNSSNWPSPTSTIINNIVNETLDGEPDQFFFSFGGRSGEFVMGPTTTSSTVKHYRTVPYQKIQIQPTITSGQIQSWQITIEDGTKYTFEAKETNTDYNSTTPGGQIPAHFGESYTSSWHLTEIMSPGGDVISFYYGSYTARHRIGTYIERFDQVVSNPAGCVPTQSTVINEYEITVQRLDSIKAAAHTIKFTTALRSDALHPTSGAQQERRIDKIIVTTPTGTVLRQFLFDHDYFSGNRLRLRNVYEQDPSGASLPPYSFTYDGQSLPAIASNAQDHWGYHNGKTNSSLIPPAVTPSGAYLTGADRSPDPTKMRMGILTKITYPTGGYNEFVYEANDYGAIGHFATAPTDSGPPQSSPLNANGFQGLVSTTFTIGGTQSVIATVNVSLDPACGTQAGCPWAEIVGVQVFNDPGIYYLELDPDTYTQRASDEAAGGHASISISWRDVGPAWGKKKLAGGLRVAEVRAADAMGNVTIRKYKYTLQSDSTRSSGIVNAEPAYTYYYFSSACSYFSRSSTSKMPLGSGAPVVYREVTVWNGSNGEYGKTRHTFRSVKDAADGQTLVASWPYSRVTSFEWKRGQQTGMREYNAAGQIQKRDTLLYAFRDEGTPDTTTTRKFRGISINQFSAGQVGSSIVYNPFEVISAWTYQSADSTTLHNETGGGSFSTSRSYSYDNPKHVQLTKIVEINSDGRQRTTRMRYPADYDTGSGNAEAIALTAMQGTAHMHSPVIERWVTETVGSTETILEAVLTTFRAVSGRYLPYQRFVIDIPGALP
jgi:hypothetical protein